MGEEKNNEQKMGFIGRGAVANSSSNSAGMWK